MGYPNVDFWGAMRSGSIDGDDGSVALSTLPVGELVLPTGRLVMADPFSTLRTALDTYLQVPPGRYPVVVTLADLSSGRDGSHVREAYVSLLLNRGTPELFRRMLLQNEDGDLARHVEMSSEGDFAGFPVDSGTACVVDAGAIQAWMPTDDDWDNATLSDAPASWASRLDAADHFREGLANVPLTRAMNGENIVLVHSGWGDGVYPVVGGFDAGGRLVRIHIDFLVCMRVDEL